MKATLSNDGLMRADLRTEHRVCGRDVAVMVLAFRSSGYPTPDEIGDRWSRAGLLRFVRQVLQNHGDHAYNWPPDGWRDDYELDGNLAEAVRWAVELVREHLPELADDDLRKWAGEELHADTSSQHFPRALFQPDGTSCPDPDNCAHTTDAPGEACQCCGSTIEGDES